MSQENNNIHKGPEFGGCTEMVKLGLVEVEKQEQSMTNTCLMA
jgi:hypothetical protein